MRSAITAALVVAMSAASWAQTKEDDAKLLKSFESKWQKAAEKASAVVVSIRVERDDTREAKGVGGRPPASNPMMDGGVFKRPPDRTTFVCDDCAVEEVSAAKCPKCEKDLRKTVRSQCTGTIVDADGLIATSWFNVMGKVSRLVVTLESGKEYEGKLLGSNQGADVALIRIEAKGLPVLQASDLSKLKTGSNIVVLGRAPDGKSLTLNEGILSAPQRQSGFAWQFDALTNYGNVGGPLVDLDGKLIGVSCKINVATSGSVGQNSGISFACTVDHMARLLPDLKAGKVMVTGRPFMGISADVNATGLDGVKLADVIKGGGAERAGLKAGDVVLEFDGQATKVFDDLRAMIEKKAIGDQFRVKVRRGEEEFEFTGTLGERPADQ